MYMSEQKPTKTKFVINKALIIVGKVLTVSSMA